MNREANDKSRVMYCSPSNKAVDVIGKFLKNRFFSESKQQKRTYFQDEEAEEEEEPFEFSFVRVYSERIASSEYPSTKIF